MNASNNKWWILVAIITVLGFALRWPLLNGSFWLDEAAQALESTRPWSQQFDIAADFQPPLYHLFVFLLGHISWNEAWLRIASFLPGLGSIVLSAMIGRRLFSPQAGLVAATMLAVSSLMVFYSQELRPYMLAVFWAELSWLAWIEWRDNPQYGTGWFWCLLFSLMFGLWSSYVFLFWWAALWLMSWFAARKFGERFTLLSFVSGTFWLAWWPWFWQQWQVGQDLRTSLPGWELVVSIPQLKAVPLLLGKFLVGIAPLDVSLPDITLLLLWYGSLAVGLAWLGKRRSLWTTGQRNLREVLALFFLGVLLTWGFSWLTPVLAPKRVLFLLPVLAVAVAGLLDKVRGMWFGVILFVGINLVSLLRYWNEPALQRENWRAAVQTIEADFSAQNTVMIFGFDQAFAPWRWYATEQFPILATGLIPLTDTAQLRAELTLQTPEYIVVFDYLRDLTDPDDQILTLLDSLEYAPRQVYDYPNIGFIRVYQRATLYAGKYQ